MPAFLCLMHILPAAGLILLEKSGCRIWQEQFPWYGWLMVALTLLCAVHALIRRPDWSRINRASALVLLPLGCLSGIFLDSKATYAGWLPALLCALFAIPVFIRGRARWFLKLPAAVLSVFALLFIAMGCFFEAVGFVPEVTVLSKVSPDGDRIAVVECIDEGALGGRTQGYVYQYRPDSPLDRFIRRGKMVMDHGFLCPDEVILRWRDNDTVEMNDGYHSAEDLFN